MTYVTNAEVFRACGLPSSGGPVSSSDVDAHIVHAEALVARRMNLAFAADASSYTTVTSELQDGNGTDTMFVFNTPLRALTTLEYTLDNGTTYPDITTTKVWFDVQSGRITLKPTAEVTRFPKGIQTIRVTYTHGLIPGSDHKRYMIVVAALMVLIEQVGGTYDDITSFQLPEIQGSLGEPWTQIRETIQRLSDERRYWEEYFRPRVFMA